MSGLFSSLQSASSALNLFSQALAADQRNVANASTAGFASQRINIQASATAASGGADVVEISSTGSSFADATVQAAGSRAAESQTQARRLSPVNQLFDITGSAGILAALQKFSTAFASLSVSPNDPALGALALRAAGNVASSFNTVASGLDTQKAQVDAGIGSATQRINGLAQRIRDFNVRAHQGGGLDASTEAGLRDGLDQLASLVDITVTRNSDGSVSVLAGGQLPLVIGDQAYGLSVDSAGQVASSGGGNSPGTFSGELGALLQTRNVAIGQIIGTSTSPGTLNTLAAGFAARVNTLLVSGVTATGSAGVPIFTFDAVSASNSARTLALDLSITADQLGLATTGASAQANGIANQLAALPSSNRAADQISGLPALGLFGSIAASAGQQLSDANIASTTDQTALTLAQTDRQREIGVSLDAEAVAITAFQRAYQANAQIVSIIDRLTLTAVNLIGPTSG